MFTHPFSSTPRGAHLARHIALQRLDAWGFPYGGHVSDTAAVLVGELAANAVTHGRVPGRDFELVLALSGGVLRIEVSDTRGEVRPRNPLTPRPAAAPLAETGRGLFLVAALADRWDVLDRDPIGKTVVAELDLPV